MTPKPKQMPREPFLAPEASSGSGGTSRDLLGPPPHDPPPGVPPPGVPHDAPPSDSHFKKMNAGWWLHKTPPPARQSGDYRNVTDEIMCLELCLRKALLFTFKITIALTLILWHFYVQTYPYSKWTIEPYDWKLHCDFADGSWCYECTTKEGGLLWPLGVR